MNECRCGAVTVIGGRALIGRVVWCQTSGWADHPANVRRSDGTVGYAEVCTWCKSEQHQWCDGYRYQHAGGPNTVEGGRFALVECECDTCWPILDTEEIQRAIEASQLLSAIGSHFA